MLRKKGTKFNRLFSLAMAACMAISVVQLPNLTNLSTMALVNEDKREADTNTMNSFNDALNLAENSLNAGRVWSDKSVLTDEYVELDMVNDGINGVTIDSESDFLHVFSALGSSRNYDGLIPSNLVIVIDNSGSMYANDKVTWKWENTRISKTVDAVNRAIDRLMENDVMAQVSVVSFNNTGRTIIPMGHYSFTPDENGVEKYTKYLDAGWVLAQEPDGNSEPNHTDHSRVTGGGTASGDDDDEGDDSSTIDEDSGGGYIYVNNAAIGVKSNKKYTLYRSKSTNIQAGIYQGMEELLNAPKTATIPGTNIVLERVPSLVVLTDGQATDAVKGQWSNPSRTDEGLLDDLTFTNGFSKKKWLSFYDDCINPNTGKLVYGWHRFLTTNSLKEGYTYKMMGPSEQGTKVADHYTLDKSKGDNRLPGLIEDFKETQEYMLLSTLMTAGYMKAAINNAYTQECKVYTISVDMNDPADVNYKENVAKGNVDIDSNPPMMNPSKYFSIDWLKEVGVLKANNNVNTSVYKEKTTGSQTVYSIRDAVTDFQNWQNNGAEIKLDYRTITNNVAFTDDSKGRGSYIQDYTRPYGSNYWITGTPQQQTIKHLGNDGNNPYNLTDKDIDVNYADVSYYAQSSVDAADSIENIFNTIMNQVTAKTFTPISGKNDVGIGNALTYMDPIGQYMEIKDVSDITLFGTQYGVTKTAVYDPIFVKGGTFTGDGWYDKNGKRLSSGNWENGSYYVSADTAAKYIPTLKSNIVSTIYSISSVKAGIDPFKGGKFDSTKELSNPCYEDDSGITFSLGSIHLWVEDSGDYVDDAVDGGGIESDTGYDQALYVNIPANALPLQVSTTKFKEDLKESDKSKAIKVDSYSTNSETYEQSTPLRVFYHVGLVDSIKTTDGRQVDREKISADYIHENSNANGDIYFYSNWYKPNSYSYNSAGQTYTRGDPVLTFSPDNDNRYYTAQTPMILYTYNGNDDPNYEGLTVQRQGDGSYRTNNGTFTEVKDKIGDNQWYYIINSYFTYDKSIAYNAYARHSTEFGRDIGGDEIKNGAYLCWYDTVNEVIRDYINASGDPVPSPGANWVVALRPGSLRTGNMFHSVGKKDSTAIPNTAGTYYLPTISSSTSGLTADGVIINEYHGNNGRTTVPSTQIIITKFVNSLAYELPPDKDDMDFEFELKLGDKIGDFLATVLKRTSGSDGVWIRQVASVTVNTTDSGLLLDNGESMSHSVKTYGDNNEFYLYVPQDNRTVNEPTKIDDDAIQTFTIKAYKIPTIEVDSAGLSDWTFNANGNYSQVLYDVYKSPENGGAGNALSGNAWTSYVMQTKKLTFDKYSHTTFTLKDREGILVSGLNSGTDFTTREILRKNQGFNFVKVTNEDGSEYVRNDKRLPLIEEDRGNGTVAYTISGFTTAENPSEAHYENTYATTLMVTKEIEIPEGVKSRLKDIDNVKFDFEVKLKGEQGNFDAYVLKKNGTAWERQVDTITNAVTFSNGLLLAADDSTGYEIIKYDGQDYYLYVPQDNSEAKPDSNGDYWITVLLIPKDEVVAAGITDWSYKENDYKSISHKLTLITTDTDTNTTYGNARTVSSFSTMKLTFGADNTANFTLKDGEGLQIIGIDPDTDYTVTEILSKELQARNFSFTSITDEDGKVFTTESEDTVVENYKGGTAYQIKGTTTPDPLGDGSQAHYLNAYNGNYGFEISKITIKDGKEVALNGVEFMLEYKVEGKWYPVYYVETKDSNGNTVTQLSYDLENSKTMEQLKDEGITIFTTFTSQGVNKKGETVDGLLKFDNLFEGDFRLTEVSTLPGLNKLASTIEFHLPYAVDKKEIEEYEKNHGVQLSDDYTEDEQTRYYNYITFKINNTAAQFDLPLTGTNGINYVISIIGVAFILSGAGIFFYIFKRKKKF